MRNLLRLLKTHLNNTTGKELFEYLGFVIKVVFFLISCSYLTFFYLSTAGDASLRPITVGLDKDNDHDGAEFILGEDEDDYDTLVPGART